MPIARTIFHNGSHGSDATAADLKRVDSFLEKNPPTRGLPRWIPWAMGALGIGAIIYGLFQIESVRNVASDFLFGDEFEENEYIPRAIEDESDFGSGDFGSSASERLRSQL